MADCSRAFFCKMNTCIRSVIHLCALCNFLKVVVKNKLKIFFCKIVNDRAVDRAKVYR